MNTEKKLTTIEKVLFLKSVDIFEHATVEQLGRIAGLTEEVHFEPGETIFNEGELGDAFYVLLSDRVSNLRKTAISFVRLRKKKPLGLWRCLTFTLGL